MRDWLDDPAKIYDKNQLREIVESAIQSLPPIYREVFVLRDMQHLSTEETATALDISSASVKVRLLRARLMLRDLLAPGLGGTWTRAQTSAKRTP